MAVLLTLLLIFGWEAAMQYYYPNAKRPVPAAGSAAPAPDPAHSAKPSREGGLADPADAALEVRDLQTALNPAGRVPIAARSFYGSGVMSKGA
jgi:YidC/Oxa1 family membrane protein insertase